MLLRGLNLMRAGRQCSRPEARGLCARRRVTLRPDQLKAAGKHSVEVIIVCGAGINNAIKGR